MPKPFEIYRAANARLDALIDSAPMQDRSLIAIMSRAEARLARTERFLHFLGNPHHSAPVIHVAGTSGKGSTATAITYVLQAAGYHTLLHTSPYLQVATEKLLINGRLINARAFAELADILFAEMAVWGEARLTYAEAWMALIGLAMARFQPDVAIIEVGAGGRFDLTNLVRSEVAVITSIGLDHTETLGSTIREIAWHKAGIVKTGSTVVQAVDDPVAVAEIVLQAEAVDALVLRANAPALRKEDHGQWSWRDDVTGSQLVSALSGRVQAQNAALAVAAARAWRPDLTLDAIQSGLAAVRFAARFERMAGAQMVILDGAHNPQKISSLVRELDVLPRPRIGVAGFLAAKRAGEMLAMLAPHLDAIVLTSPHVIGKPGLAVDAAVALAESVTSIPVTGEPDPLRALNLALERAGDQGSVLVTGSLFLCGALRERWYPSDAIVAQQTQWPAL